MNIYDALKKRELGMLPRNYVMATSRQLQEQPAAPAPVAPPLIMGRGRGRGSMHGRGRGRARTLNFDDDEPVAPLVVPPVVPVADVNVAEAAADNFADYLE